VTQLWAELEKAEDFYVTFLAEFDSEVEANPKKYASRTSINSLWYRKARDTKPRPKPKSDDEEENQADLRSNKQHFEDDQKSLPKTLTTALSATYNKQANRSAIDKICCGNAGRMHDKVKLSKEHLVRLLKESMSTREPCVMLLAEIKYLKGLINPDDEDNKAMYSQIDG
jgi:hypothetical protein